MSEGHVTLAMLHDLALLYLGLAHGADGDLDPEEANVITAKLRRWQPDKDPALIDHVMREATLTYLNESSEHRIDDAIVTLSKVLPTWLRHEILKDMADIARADGMVIAEEDHFMRSLARAWNVDAQPA